MLVRDLIKYLRSFDGKLEIRLLVDDGTTAPLHKKDIYIEEDLSRRKMVVGILPHTQGCVLVRADDYIHLLKD